VAEVLAALGWFEAGPDGRNIYTKDPDARGGHRFATGRRNAGPYVGYELHLAVTFTELRAGMPGHQPKRRVRK
jgi:hypothetical protein